ncbi:MAG: glycosyltransferase family 2 protein [Lachnospiraceae bacterium]|nr:glycosyltransferase family 2 protein [Lachnospiraceae bacterium]
MPQTTVLIPNYNGIDYIEGCIESIRRAGDYPIVIVDNGSCDGSREVIEAHLSGEAAPAYNDIELIPLAENTGFCHAVNAGLEKIKTEYVFLLNNDTTITPDTISALEKRMDSDPRIFAVQSKILSMSDPDVIDDSGDLYCALGWAFTPGKGKSAEAYSRPCKVFACCGAAVLYRMSAFDDVGNFDEEHFAYLEDIDIGYRARIMGYRNVYEPSSVIFHAGSAVSGSRYNRFKVNLAAQNSIYIIYKNMPLVQFILNLPLLLIGFLIKTLFFSLKLMGFTYLRGLLRGFKLCGKDIKNGHRNKVWFRPRYLGRYALIQFELWVNTVRRFAG